MIYILKFGEIFLKGKWKRKEYIRNIKLNIKHIFKHVRIKQKDNVLLVESDKDIFEDLKHIFGIEKVGEIIRIARDLNKLYETLNQFSNKFTYKLKVKRIDKTYELKSMDLLKQIIANIHIPLGVKTYDKLIKIEIHSDSFWIYKRDEKGVGGYPKSHERVLLFFSGGFDSTLSLFLLLRAGLDVIPVLLFRDKEDKKIPNEIISYFKKTYYFERNLIEINLSSIIPHLLSINARIRQMVFKRFIYILGNCLAKKYNVKYIAFGESLNQVHTQTLHHLNLLQQKIDVFILRPVLFYKKEEIINEIRKLGLYKLCSNVKEKCKITDKFDTYIKANELFKYDEQLTLLACTHIDKFIENRKITSKHE